MTLIVAAPLIPRHHQDNTIERTRRPRRTPAPTRRPPSAVRNRLRDANNLVRRVDWKEGECAGNPNSLSAQCKRLNDLVCQYRRGDLESRERRACERVGLEFGRKRRPSENGQLIEFEEEEEDVVVEEE